MDPKLRWIWNLLSHPWCSSESVLSKSKTAPYEIFLKNMDEQLSYDPHPGSRHTPAVRCFSGARQPGIFPLNPGGEALWPPVPQPPLSTSWYESLSVSTRPGCCREDRYTPSPPSGAQGWRGSTRLLPGFPPIMNAAGNAPGESC